MIKPTLFSFSDEKHGMKEKNGYDISWHQEGFWHSLHDVLKNN